MSFHLLHDRCMDDHYQDGLSVFHYAQNAQDAHYAQNEMMGNSLLDENVEDICYYCYEDNRDKI